MREGDDLYIADYDELTEDDNQLISSFTNKIYELAKENRNDKNDKEFSALIDQIDPEGWMLENQDIEEFKKIYVDLKDSLESRSKVKDNLMKIGNFIKRSLVYMSSLGKKTLPKFASKTEQSKAELESKIKEFIENRGLRDAMYAFEEARTITPPAQTPKLKRDEPTITMKGNVKIVSYKKK